MILGVPPPASIAESDIWSGRLRSGVAGASLVVVILALLGVAGWLLGVPELATLGTGSRPMMPSGVVVLLAGAVSLRALGSSRAHELRWRVRLCALLVLAISVPGLGLEEGWVSANSAEMLFRLRWLDWPPTSVGAASCYVLLGVALLLSTLPGQRAWEWTQYLAAMLGGVALVALVGLTFRLLRLDLAIPSLGIALPVALGLVATSFGLMLTRPASRLLQLLEHDSPGAIFVRRLVPLAIGLPLLAAWLQVLGVRVGWFESVESAGALTVVGIAAGVVLILWTSSRLDEMNHRRSIAEGREATQRQWLEATLASIGDAVITFDDEGRVSLVNPAAEELLELEASDAIGREVGDVLTLVDEVTGAPLGSPLHRAFSGGFGRGLAGEPAVLRSDGSLRAVEVAATPIHGTRDRLTGGVLVLRDVSVDRARAHAEREAFMALDQRVAERTEALDYTMNVLRESTELLRTITATTPELIVAKGRDGRIIMINAAALELMGMHSDQIIGRREEEVLGDTEETRLSVRHDRQVIESGRPVVVEERRTVGGVARTYLVTKSPLREESDHVFGVVGVATDITERKRAQVELEQLLVAEHRLRGEAERANRAKDEFLAIVSHELRSPLNALKGWSQILAGASTLEPELINSAAAAIKRNIDHQTRLIDDLLDTSRIISGKLELNLYCLNLAEVVAAALDLSREPAQAKHIELRVSCKDSMVPVEGDFDRLQQVISNLLSNAIKFTPEHGTVDVVLQQSADEIELTVTDNGIGIDPDFLPHVFDRFSQADTSMTRNFLGLGIGLALVRNLVELHHGSVRAASRGPHQGAAFTVVLPRARGDVLPRLGNHEVERPLGRPLDGVTVLLADDEQSAREVMRLMLVNAGASVREFDSGEALLAFWHGDEPLPERAVLLLDIAMPGSSGLSVLRRLRATGRRRPVPAVACTAFTHLADERFAEAGFQSRLGKPVQEDRLIETLIDALGRTSEIQTPTPLFEVVRAS